MGRIPKAEKEKALMIKGLKKNQQSSEIENYMDSSSNSCQFETQSKMLDSFRIYHIHVFIIVFSFRSPTMAF